MLESPTGVGEINVPFVPNHKRDPRKCERQRPFKSCPRHDCIAAGSTLSERARRKAEIFGDLLRPIPSASIRLTPCMTVV
jgi:hypothetical protein